MFEIIVRDSFSAAHSVRGSGGKCDKMHGHNWDVEITVASDKLDKNGMVADFLTVKAGLKSVLKKLDHKYLNKLVFFAKNNPTAENVAYYLYKKLAPIISRNGGAAIKKVRVGEMNNAEASIVL